MEGPPRRLERVGGRGEPVVLIAQAPWTSVAEDLDRYTGTYFSDELQARWDIGCDGSTLVVKNLRAPAHVLSPAFRDVFTSDGLVVRFDSNDGPSNGFAVGAGRARGLRFARVAP